MKPSKFSVSDLNRLAATLAAIDLSPADRAILAALIAFATETATAHEAAAAAGLVIDSAPVVGSFAGMQDTFIRASTPGGPAAVGNDLGPHR